MSFGSSNPPWQRNTLGNAGQQNAIANLQSQLMNQNFVGFQNLAMSNQAPQNNLTLIPQLGANINQINNANTLFANHQAMQYQNQNRPGLNPNAFGTVQNSSQIMHHQAQSQQSQAQSQGNQNNAAQMCNTAAFKWNPGLVQQVTPTNQGHGMNARSNANQSQMQHSMQSTQQQRNFSGYSGSQPQNSYANNFERGSNSVRGSNHSSRQSPPPRRSSPDRSSRRDEEERKRRKDREREREKEQEKRDDRSPARRISPRRRTRPIPRYMVQVPKINLNASEADILELRRRYNNLYVPSEFFYSRICWSESFPCHAPFSIKKPSSFHIFHKSVENPNGPDNGAELDPPDADDSFSAKVMLMSVPPMTEFYRECFANVDEKDRDDPLHPSRLISFLVGVMGKNETVAIGGAWSPSRDGPNPDKDPAVLIKTAIRTCKAMTGIDLSPCTQWYRFVELYYRRVESVRKGRPARTQTVVIFLPDVRSCLPTRLEWDELSIKYKTYLELKGESNDDKDYDDFNKRQSISKSDELTHDDNVGDVEMVDETNISEQDATTASNTNECQENAESSNPKEITDGESNLASSTAVISKDGKTESSKLDTSNISEADVKTMKIQELRDHLDARKLSSDGLKRQLVSRLTKALKTEEVEKVSTEDANESKVEEQECNESNADADPNDSASNDDSMDIDLDNIVVIDEYDSTKTDTKTESSSKRSSSRKSDERSQRWLEKRYRLPENPQILCHPIQTSSMDKFTCDVRSLSILLDYRPEDSKKHCFEVSLFAELFNEMLMRDFGFNIYKVLYSMPESELNENEPKDRRDKTTDDEPKEKRHRKDVETSSDVKSSKKDESSSSSHDKSKTDGEKDPKSSKDSKSKDKEKEKEKSHRETRTSRREDDSDDERSVDGKKRETKKLVTVDPDLLLSFVYFDQTHCGYIFSNHLEELFFSLGLRLSRSDTKRIINKVAPRSLFYRKLTDKPKEEATSAIVTESIANLEELGKGNNILLPIFENITSIQTNSKTLQQSSNEETIAEKSEKSDDVSGAESHMVMHKGALIDIEKLLQQLNRSEKAREETEIRLTELTKTHSELQSSNSKAKDKIKDLQSELKSSNRKVNDVESSLSSTNKKCTEYYSILSGIHDKVSPLFIKNERSSSKKDSTSRDRERRDREKEKNNGASTKEKDKDKDAKDKTVESKTEVKQEKLEKQESPEKPVKVEKQEKQEEN